VFRCKITGVKEIDRALRRIPQEMQKKALKQGLTAALKPVRKAIQADAPVKTGNLRRSIQIKLSKGRKTGMLWVAVGWRKKKKSDKPPKPGVDTRDAFYTPFQEFGWGSKIKGKRKKGSKRNNKQISGKARQVPGKHFIENAFKATAGTAVSDAERLILEKIEGIINKLKSK
jgi:HK97 gp10 family phage protein